MALAAGLDRLVGDPRSWLHPVQVMGWLIGRLRGLAESWAGDHPRRLRLAGVLITVLLVCGSGLAGWQIERLAIDPAIEAEACQRVAALRARRDAGRVAELRGQLETAARGAENLMPLLVSCAESDMTLGEICGTLRAVWGEYRPAL